MKKKLLIVFAKNPRLGKVKTRLAASVGNEKALRIYHLLLDHTARITADIEVDKVVHYSDFIPASDLWLKLNFKQHLQRGNDLGERMATAFRSSFIRGYEQVVLIGSDCYELDQQILEQAFKQLDTNDVVLGPAKDGGYYLIGMNEFYGSLFDNIQWSTSSVLSETKKILEQNTLSYSLLPELSDIDDLNDLMRYDDLFVLI